MINIHHRHSGDLILSVPSLAGADLRDASPTKANLREANLTEANLTGVSLWYADLTGADLGGANLTDADLTEADLTGADLTGADLTGANLRDASLTTADLARANLTRADLRYADLGGANLIGANLTKANLRDASLTGAILTSAILRATKFSGLRPINSLAEAAKATGDWLAGGRWQQRKWIETPTGAYAGDCLACLHGAAVYVGGSYGPLLSQRLSDLGYTEEWNDAPGRSLAEVLQALKEVATSK